MKIVIIIVSMVFSIVVLTACGGNSSSATGTIYGVPAVIAAKASALSPQMGGSMQAAPLAVFSNVTTAAGTAGIAGSLNTPVASFYQPNGIASDGTSLYITDYRNHVIRKMDIASGVVTTFAGVPGIAGSVDTANGVVATFNFPNAITTDGASLFVTDASYTVRKIDITTKTVTTLAGLAGTPGSADGTGVVSGVAGTARFGQLKGITTDGNYIYVSDSNNTIRWLDKVSGDVKTLAGTASSTGTTDGAPGVARFNLPTRLTCDGPNLYVCDFNNKTVRKIDIASGTVSTIAGTPLSSSSVFNQPNGITSDGTNLYVSDAYNYTILKLTPPVSGTLWQVLTIAGTSGVAGAINGVTTRALFDTPIGITTDGLSIYVTDSNNHTIRRIY